MKQIFFWLVFKKKQRKENWEHSILLDGRKLDHVEAFEDSYKSVYNLSV